MTTRQLLDKTDLFGSLPPELLSQLRDRTTLERLHRGDVIFEKGDAASPPVRGFSFSYPTAQAAQLDRVAIAVGSPGQIQPADPDRRAARRLCRVRRALGAPAVDWSFRQTFISSRCAG